MIALLLMLAAADAPKTALDAELAFDQAAVRDGQWTAFRTFAAPDAIMFVPQPVNAQAWLKDRKDPPKSVRWQATASYVSCDGATTVNTGNWQRADGSVGYFTTVWQRQSDGSWRWVLDSGDALKAARAAKTPTVTHASCDAPDIPFMTPPPSRGAKSGHGASKDGTLTWDWEVLPDGARMLGVNLRTGMLGGSVIDDRIAAEK